MQIEALPDSQPILGVLNISRGLAKWAFHVFFQSFKAFLPISVNTLPELTKPLRLSDQ